MIYLCIICVFNVFIDVFLSRPSDIGVHVGQLVDVGVHIGQLVDVGVHVGQLVGPWCFRSSCWQERLVFPFFDNISYILRMIITYDIHEY